MLFFLQFTHPQHDNHVCLVLLKGVPEIVSYITYCIRYIYMLDIYVETVYNVLSLIKTEGFYFKQLNFIQSPFSICDFW